MICCIYSHHNPAGEKNIGHDTNPIISRTQYSTKIIFAVSVVSCDQIIWSLTLSDKVFTLRFAAFTKSSPKLNHMLEGFLLVAI